jgi:hypothetical protein
VGFGFDLYNRRVELQVISEPDHPSGRRYPDRSRQDVDLHCLAYAGNNDARLRRTDPGGRVAGNVRVNRYAVDRCGGMVSLDVCLVVGTEYGERQQEQRHEEPARSYRFR